MMHRGPSSIKYTLSIMNQYMITNEFIQSYIDYKNKYVHTPQPNRNINNNSNNNEKSKSIITITTPHPHPKLNNIYQKANISNNPRMNNVSTVPKTSIIQSQKSSRPPPPPLAPQKYSLFWCFYLLKKGHFEYNMIGRNNFFTVEQEYRFYLLDQLKQNKHILKNNKLYLSQIEPNLSKENDISIQTFIALCAVNNINTIIIDGQKMFKNIYDVDNPDICVLIKHNRGYTMNFDLSKTKIIDYELTHLVFSGSMAKLKSVSGYTITQLIDMCRCLKISTNDIPKITKQTVYNKIKSTLSI